MRLIAKVYNYYGILHGYILGDIETCETRVVTNEELKEYLLAGNKLDNAKYNKGNGQIAGTEGSLTKLPIKRYNCKGQLVDINVNILAILQKGKYNSDIVYKVLNHTGKTQYMTEANLIKFILDKSVSICNARVTFYGDGRVKISPIRGNFKELDTKFLTNDDLI